MKTLIRARNGVDSRGRGVDVVLDTVGGDTFPQQSRPGLPVYGQVVTLLDPGKDINWGTARNKNLGIHFTLMLTPMLKNMMDARQHQGEILNRCSELIEAGKLETVVSHEFALEDAAKAHALIEEGHVLGKVVLR